jgi:hypothetical protein
MIEAAKKKAVRLRHRLLPGDAALSAMPRTWLYVGLLTLAGCAKGTTELDRLPAPTRQGLATAGWLLNGQAHVPRRSDASAEELVLGYWEKTAVGHSLSLVLREPSRDGQQGLGFFLPDLQRAATYALDRTPTRGGAYDVSNAAYGEYYSTRLVPDLNGVTGPNAPGQLVITCFDTVRNVVAGTFALNLRAAGDGTPLVITHGRFDVRLTRR